MQLHEAFALSTVLVHQVVSSYTNPELANCNRPHVPSPGPDLPSKVASADYVYLRPFHRHANLKLSLKPRIPE